LLAAGPEENAPQLYTLAGMLGPSRIGMSLVVRDDRLLEGSHYFYGKYLRDIPLTGSAGAVITLREPGVGVFILRYKGNGSEGGKKLDLQTSIGLTGAWSAAGRTLPVALSLEGSGVWSGRFYGDVTDESDAAFEARVQGFYRAVMAGDRAGVARSVRFPLRVNIGHAGKYWMVRTPAQLEAGWSRVFPDAWLKQAAREMPHDLGVVRGEAMLGPGLAWFGPQGVTTINEPE
jgi:hypothetical protein